MLMSLRENGHNSLVFSARNKFLYFFMHRFQRGIQWCYQILPFVAPWLKKTKKKKWEKIRETPCKTNQTNPYQTKFKQVFQKIWDVQKCCATPVRTRTCSQVVSFYIMQNKFLCICKMYMHCSHFLTVGPHAAPARPLHCSVYPHPQRGTAV